MSLRQQVTGEIKAIGLVTLYFASWFGMMILLKRLVLAEHQIEFRGVSTAIVGALIVAKVGLDREDAIEMYYKPWLNVTADLQIIAPALKKTLDSSGNNLKDVDTAVVAGLRLYVRF